MRRIMVKNNLNRDNFHPPLVFIQGEKEFQLYADGSFGFQTVGDRVSIDVYRSQYQVLPEHGYGEIGIFKMLVKAAYGAVDKEAKIKRIEALKEELARLEQEIIDV